MKGGPGDSLSRRLRLTRLAVLAERLSPLATALAGLIGLFLAFALSGLSQLLPGWLHLAALLAFAGIAAFLIRRLLAVPRPTEDEVARRLERESGSRHRPLTALSDTRAGGDAELWRRHGRRMAAEIMRLRPGWPRPVLAAADPYALRFAVLLLVVLTAAGGWRDGGRRLADALSPAVVPLASVPDSLEVWVEPPAYTRLGPILLKPGQPVPAALPLGSTFKASISGGWGDARLRLDQTVQPFHREEGGSQRIEVRIESISSIRISQGWREVAVWPVSVLPDTPPAIAFGATPEGDERGRLRLEVQASDDYGLAAVWVEVLPLDAAAGTAPLRLEIRVPEQAAGSLYLGGRFDLAAHDWAGRPARLTPRAEDGAGQIGSGESAVITLPERDFHNPVAQALVRWRQEVSDAPRQGPEVAERVRELEDDLGLFNDDGRVLLSLALTRHMLARPDFDREELRDLMWNAATRIEDGGLSAGEQGLDEARRALEQALADNAPAERLAELAQRYRDALERLLRIMVQRGMVSEAPDGTRTIDGDQLGEMLDQLRDLAETGDRDALRRRLDELSKLMEGLGQAGPPSGGAMPPEAKALEALRDLARSQRDLLDQSFRHATPPAREDEGEGAQPRTAGKGDAAEARRAAEAQRLLERGLGDLTRGLDPKPKALDQAGRSMAGAAAALDRGDWDQAVEEQTDILRQIGQGAAELADRMAAARGRGQGGMVARDPFGRRQGAGPADDRSTRIPAQAEIRRAREIVDELRRRSGESNRPEPERDYIRRLLRQF